MQSKSDLVSRCHELVDAVKEQERELAAEVRSVYKDAEQVIETEKKAFRSGYEDRLQKVPAILNHTNCAIPNFNMYPRFFTVFDKQSF